MALPISCSKNIGPEKGTRFPGLKPFWQETFNGDLIIY
jgi:hypothetical protein